MPSIEEKIKKIESQFKSDDIEVPDSIQNLGREYKVSKSLLSIANTDAIRNLILEYATDINRANNRLIHQEEMDQIERTALFVERRFKQEFIDKFNEKQEFRLRDLENQIDEELN